MSTTPPENFCFIVKNKDPDRDSPWVTKVGWNKIDSFDDELMRVYQKCLKEIFDGIRDLEENRCNPAALAYTVYHDSPLDLVRLMFAFEQYGHDLIRIYKQVTSEIIIPMRREYDTVHPAQRNIYVFRNISFIQHVEERMKDYRDMIESNFKIVRDEMRPLLNTSKRASRL